MNYKTGSAEGISLTFLAVWFIGDVTNLLGAVWASLVPTVVALAIYFCVADTVLIVQCLYYKRITFQKAAVQSSIESPRQPLLARKASAVGLPGLRRESAVSYQDRESERFSPEVPFSDQEWVGNGVYKNVLCVLAVCAIGVAGWALSYQIGVWTPANEHRGADTTTQNAGALILGYISAMCYLG